MPELNIGVVSYSNTAPLTAGLAAAPKKQSRISGRSDEHKTPVIPFKLPVKPYEVAHYSRVDVTAEIDLIATGLGPINGT